MAIIDRRLSVTDGVAVKAPCRAAATGNVALAGLQTVDGISLAEGDRVLVKNQSTASENGIYSASSGNWTRTRDFDGAFDVVSGTRVWVNEGDLNSASEWAVTTSGAIEIGASLLSFAPLGGLGTSFADGSAGAPGMTFASALNFGFYKTASGIGVSIDGAPVMEFAAGAFVGTAHLAAQAVTLAKLVHASATARILLRRTVGGGTWEEGTLSQLLDFIGSAGAGDMLIRGASDWQRLAAGVNGRILTMDSGLPAWVAPAPAEAPGLKFIASQLVSSPVAQVDFTSGLDSTHDEYEFVITSLSCSAGGALQMLVGTGGGPTYQTTSYFGHASGTSGTTTYYEGPSTYAPLTLSGTQGLAGYYSGRVKMSNPTSNLFLVQGSGGYQHNDGGGFPAGVVNFYSTRTVTGPMTGIRFKMSTGNIAAGSRISMYGYRKA